MLSDQGRLEEAEPLLRRALQVWRGTADEHGVAFATALLGRLHARSGRNDEAVSAARGRARALRVAARREYDAALAKTLLAEAALFDGRAEEAHERALALLDEVSRDALLEPLLHHVVGVALAQMGDTESARAALTTALDAAHASELPLETALALDALELLDASPVRRAASWTPCSHGSTSCACPGRRSRGRTGQPRGSAEASACAGRPGPPGRRS